MAIFHHIEPPNITTWDLIEGTKMFIHYGQMFATIQTCVHDEVIATIYILVMGPSTSGGWNLA
jgi:hypothetical protein